MTKSPIPYLSDALVEAIARKKPPSAPIKISLSSMQDAFHLEGSFQCSEDTERNRVAQGYEEKCCQHSVLENGVDGTLRVNDLEHQPC